ncbi:CheR family methyltransferase [Fluoribacter dumoffii]|uniref:protein-glutamate O-methyltransferase n=1 Tax=Fluoribacter dumoffii TaxID=463 RepID=A0A377G761_9GAMM|nr:CheR family methyltransferase [Fluoribacter dumoffii]KTC89536.1 methyltransferase involved in chemotaxis (CheR domain) [Fluoribacter dumoffii NY 23]STO20646.1 Chemotaxis protein methyltransferase [Fluoribacter dumoffii]
MTPRKNKTRSKKNITSSEDPSHSLSTTPPQKSLFLIVGIGASAGGLEALRALFSHSKPDDRLAFVVVTHLSPDKISILPEILQQFTSLKVTTIADNQKIEPKHVYVLPPGRYVHIHQGILFLKEPTPETKMHPIDLFFRLLAEDQGSKSVAVILSETGNDGTIGLRVIAKQGGIVIAQIAKSAFYDVMPKSAINTGLVDYIFAPEEIYPFLINYAAHFEHAHIPIQASIAEEIKQILTLLRNNTGHDFSLYKPNTIFRRIQKRLSLLHLDNLEIYIQYIQQNPNELQILFKELLINVTNFFRDPEAFEQLKELLLTQILVNKSQSEHVRVWIPGCSTGEEVYSIAIILQECMEELKCHFNVQIFGTDIDEEAIEIARSGVFPLDIKNDISKDRLNRFFMREEHSYKVNIDIRKMIIFAVQNLIKDPPFTKLDLLSCRNLLIYLSSQLQKRLFSLFHYSLNPGGILFLGTSEAISGSVDLFTILNRRWKIFQRRGGSALFSTIMNPPFLTQQTELMSIDIMEQNNQNTEPNLSRLIERILLENYVPASFVLDEQGKIIYTYGRTSRYIEFAAGEVRLNFIDMIRPELKSKVLAAMRKVSTLQKEEILNGLPFKEDTEFKYINIRVRPLPEAKPFNRTLLLLIFEETPTTLQLNEVPKNDKKSELGKRIIQLEQELKYTKESLQSTIEELETSNEELKSSNEELQSTNEELQSTNEEIETSKEELQSLNEELTTVNSELESRIEQLSSANDDIKNLLDNTEIATIFLDKDLCIKRFTPRATEIINLIPTDVGRPINHIVSNLEYDRLMEDARRVLKTLESKTTEVVDKSGRWYFVRIIPYRTVNNIIDGVVITFLNIHNQKKAENELMRLESQHKITQEIVEKLINDYSCPALVLDKNFQILLLNNCFIKQFKEKEANLLSQNLFKIKLNMEKDILRHFLEEFVAHKTEHNECKIKINGSDYSISVQKMNSILLLLLNK